MAMKLRLILVCLAAAAFVACSPNGGQIYSIIENEKQAVDSTLPSPKTQTVANVVSTGSGGPYYVAMGAIFRGVAKSDGTIDWTGGTGGSAVAVGAPAAGASCNAMAYYGGHLWGGFVTAGTVLGLYESTTVSGAETFAGAQAVTDPSVQGLQIALIQVANGNLFVVTATVSGTDYVYNLVFYNGTTWFPVTSLTGVSAPITGVGWDGTQYWAVSSGTLQGTQTVAPVIYTGTAASPPAFTAYGAPGSYTIATTDIIHGLFASQTPLGIVILCTKNEGVYYLYGGTWYHLT
ncbi:MAG TPA: hypothetical protein VFH83_01765, partial [Spirochaetia bacterium]|nr:hypothetical protein [Spirochaetia bacterium]